MARANLYSLGAIGDELTGLLSPSAHTEASHRGLRALQRLLASCQSASPAARPPAHVVLHHLQLIRNLLSDVEDTPLQAQETGLETRASDPQARCLSMHPSLLP